MNKKRTNIIEFPKARHPISTVSNAINAVQESTEFMTNYSMINMVSTYIKEKCGTDLAFSDRVLSPKKDFKRCIQYIKNNANAFQNEQIEKSSSCAIPRELVYKWAEKYYLEEESDEDKKPTSEPKNEKKDKPKSTKQNDSKEEKGAKQIEGQIDMFA